MGRITENTKPKNFEVKDFLGNKIQLADFKGKKVVLTFFRDASCPFCNLRLQSLINNHDIFKGHNIEVITFFNSTKEDIFKYAGKQNPPFPIIPDPDLRIYKLYGVEGGFIGKLRTIVNMKKVMQAVKSEFFNTRSFFKRNTIPADFLISEDYVIVKAHYGKDFSDHLPISEILNKNNG
ncbi:peroxiredoxin family protein [Yeosuana marina]|uniref:peroxiredoxin family protein n=1 Tax=Yeosuana marina TaxID=1565536 RepID=UPI00141FD396|nr:redoxin domain-containing protein [Yeosuana marina]